MIGRGTLAAAGTQLFVLDERTGDLRIVEAVHDGYRLSSQARVFTPDVTSVTGPSIAGGRLFVRNTKEIAASSSGRNQRACVARMRHHILTGDE